MTKNESTIFGKTPHTIAGPCSAESWEQVHSTVKSLVDNGITIIRAGVWKPRTRPNQFEGKGEEALIWLKRIKDEFKVKIATEVASTEHVELALKYDIDILWLGARTTANPFAVQEIANALQGIENPFLIKNPINPELSLWLGAIERIAGAGIKNIGAVHRGFSSFQKTKYRNAPMWQIPLELKSHFPEVPLFCDPSHIAGNRSMLLDIAQKALNLNYDGLMIESHFDPDNALSDAQQQITPAVLAQLLEQLKVREATSDNAVFINHLDDLRDRVDNLDREIIEALAARMKTVEEIGAYKKDNNVSIFQLERWKEISESRQEWAKIFSLDPDLVIEMYKLIHQESIKKQTTIFNSDSTDSSTQQ